MNEMTAKKMPHLRSIMLPCECGDTVYWNTGICIREYVCKGFMIGSDIRIILSPNDFTPIIDHDNLFFVREDAEKALNVERRWKRERAMHQVNVHRRMPRDDTKR